MSDRPGLSALSATPGTNDPSDAAKPQHLPDGPSNAEANGSEQGATAAETPGARRPPSTPGSGSTADTGGPTALPPIAGIDAALTLRYLGGRPDLARRVLRQFADHYVEGLPALRAALSRGDWQQVGALAHSMKGASASIGADRLPRLAAALEEAIANQRDAAGVAAAAEDMLAELAQLVASVQTALVHAPAPPADRPGVPIDQVMAQLQTLLQAADYDAVTLMREHSARLRQRFGPGVGEIEAAMQRFDYPQALAALQALRAPA